MQLQQLQKRALPGASDRRLNGVQLVPADQEEAQIIVKPAFKEHRIQHETDRLEGFLVQDLLRDAQGIRQTSTVLGRWQFRRLRLTEDTN